MRSLVDAAAGGTLMGKTYQEASALIEEMASSAHNWQHERGKSRAASVSDIDSISSQLAALTTQVSKLSTPQSVNVNQFVCCELCSGPHPSLECPLQNFPALSSKEQANYANNFQRAN